MSKELEYIRDISYLISESYSDKEPLTENQKESKECFLRYCNEIKQALLKSQEQEKVLEIINEKNVNIIILKLAENVDEYNERIVPNGKLTKEEFDLLKRWLDNGL